MLRTCVSLAADALLTCSWQANGADDFEYRVSDCSGDAFRSVGGTIDINIASVNDKPVAEKGGLASTTYTVGQSFTTELSASDIEDAKSALVLEITALAECVATRALLPTGELLLVSSVPTRLPSGVFTLRLTVVCEPTVSIEPNTTAVREFLVRNPLARIGRWRVGTLSYNVVDTRGASASNEVSGAHWQRRVTASVRALHCRRDPASIPCCHTDTVLAACHPTTPRSDPRSHPAQRPTQRPPSQIRGPPHVSPRTPLPECGGSWRRLWCRAPTSAILATFSDQSMEAEAPSRACLAHPVSTSLATSSA